MTFVRIEDVLSIIRQHPEGVTASQLVEMDQHPRQNRKAVVNNVRSKLLSLEKYGLIERTGKGQNKAPYVWRAVE